MPKEEKTAVSLAKNRLTLFFCIGALLVGMAGGSADALTTPCTGVSVLPGDNLPALVNAHAGGTSFCIAPGIHRLTAPVDMKSRDSFIGQPGAIISGARLLTSFERSTQGLWFASGQAENDILAGTCSADRPGCQEANDVFVDDHPLRRVMSLAALSSGTFYSDHSARRIYLADDPAGHRVEVAVTGIAFRAWGVGGMVRGLVIEKFAGHGMHGNIAMVEDNEIRFNHGIGLGTPSGIVRGNFIHHNGEIGFGPAGEVRSNLLVENNEISYNDYAGYSGGWQAGGGKWGKSSYVTVRGNFFHHNDGPGIWFDWDNSHIVVENNRVEDNAREGILIEGSFDVVVRNNQVRRNGFRDNPVWTLGSGILNASSTRVEVYGNTVEDNFNGIGATERGAHGAGPYGARVTRDFDVHDNTIRMPTGRSGLVVTVGDPSYYTSKGNRFWHNRYSVGCQSPFIWNAPTTRSGFDSFAFGQWNAFGNDRDGSLESSCPGTPGSSSAAPSTPATSGTAATPSAPAPSGAPTSPAVLGPANGGFETGLTGWGRVGGREALSLGNAAPHSGSWYARVATTGGGTEGIRLPGSASTRVPAAAGGRYTISVWLRGMGKIRVRVVEYERAGNSLGAGTVSTTMTLGSSWQQLTLPVATSARTASLTVWVETAWPQATTFDVDDVAIR